MSNQITDEQYDRLHEYITDWTLKNSKNRGITLNASDSLRDDLIEDCISFMLQELPWKLKDYFVDEGIDYATLDIDLEELQARFFIRLSANAVSGKDLDDMYKSMPDHFKYLHDAEVSK